MGTGEILVPMRLFKTWGIKDDSYMDVFKGEGG